MDQGVTSLPVPLVVGVDTVYVHTNIELLPPSELYGDTPIYQYHEVQYTKDEYITLVAERANALESLVDTILGVE